MLPPQVSYGTCLGVIGRVSKDTTLTQDTERETSLSRSTGGKVIDLDLNLYKVFKIGETKLPMLCSTTGQA